MVIGEGAAIGTYIRTAQASVSNAIPSSLAN